MRLLPLALVLSSVAGPALPDTPDLPARLAGRAVLPPLVLLDPPVDAPPDAAVAGKFRGPGRHMQPGTLPGIGGIAPPFAGQPVQGLSGFAMARAADGSVWTIGDNGFGRKATSPDVLLAVHRIAPDFAAGKLDVTESIFLTDPAFRVPFRIAYEGTAARYLTGADFDPESVQVADGSIWFGDEFGPWLVRADMAGRVEAVYPVEMDGAVLRSPDHPAVDTLSPRGDDWQVGRSKGIEGLALQPGTGLLWAMLEAPLPRADGTPGDTVAALAFDPTAGRWTGQRLDFHLGPGAVAIGDINFIDARTALVLERDHGNGSPATACGSAPDGPCHRNPARVKRVIVVEAEEHEGVLQRIGRIDLMDIDDPAGHGGTATHDGRFSFPFVTVESVTVDADGAILVGNDNNLPSQSARDPAAATASEIIRIDIGDALSTSH